MQKRIILGYGVELHEAELLSTLNKLFDKFTQTDIDDLIIEMLEPSNDKTNIYRYLPESKIQAMTENGMSRVFPNLPQLLLVDSSIFPFQIMGLFCETVV